MSSMNHYTSAARLFEFPNEGYPERVLDVARDLKEVLPEASNDVSYFLDHFPTQSVDAMQELYTRSFDVQAITTLDVGYVLFGDDYKRGELLVNLTRELKEADINPGGELADHLPNLLRLLPKLEDQELINDLVNEVLVPGLDIMISEFDPNRVERRNVIYKKHYKTIIESASTEMATIYVYTLKAVRKLLENDFEIEDKKEQIKDIDFLRSVNRELSIEV